MLKTVLAAALVAAAAPAYAAGPVELMSPPYVCVSRADVEQMDRLLSDGLAWSRFRTMKEAAGQCGYFTAGSAVYLDRQVGDYSCLRKAGDLDCFWVNLSKSELQLFR